MISHVGASPLHDHDFRLLAVGQSLSWLGDAFQPVALSVAVLGSGGGATALGQVLAASIISRLLCTLIGGVWADRLRPQTIMIIADLVRASAVSAMAVLFWNTRSGDTIDPGHLWILTGLAFIAGGAGAFFFPAMQSLKPVILAADLRQRANAILSALQGAAALGGPALAGVVVWAFGPPLGFTINAATFLVSACTVALIRATCSRPARTGFLTELRDGWSAVASRDWLLAGISAAGVYHVANGVVLVLINVVAMEQLGGARAIGWIGAAQGLGALIGSGVAMRVRPHRPLVAGFVALILMPVGVLAYVWPGVLSLVLLGTAVGYAGLMFFDVCWETSVQNTVPHDQLARVASWDVLASFVGFPLGSAIAGTLAARYGTADVLIACAAVLVVASLSPLVVQGTRRLTAMPAPLRATPS